MAVRINNRLYERRQQKRQGKTGMAKQATIYKSYGKELKRMTPKLTATGTHAGPVDIDAAQKAKTELVCYNCGKKGRTRRMCKAPKKPWRPVPQNGSAMVEVEDVAGIHVVERTESMRPQLREREYKGSEDYGALSTKGFLRLYFSFLKPGNGR